MTTTTPTESEMNARVARFHDLAVIDAQDTTDIPLPVLDLIYVRKLKPVIGLNDQGDGPMGRSAPIVGAAGITLSYGICPPGTGPTLHCHRDTYETFTVLKSRFRFSWGNEGEHSVELGPMDVISIPPGINRAFTNVGSDEGIVHVVISGNDHNDAWFPSSTAEKIRAVDEKYLDHFKKHHLKFG